MRKNTYEAMVNNSQILLKEFPKFDENINKYFDKKNGWTSQFTIVNTFNKKFSLAVTIYEDELQILTKENNNRIKFSV